MGENNVKEIKCESVKDFIQRISYGGDLYKLNNWEYIYRGESSDKYKLIPSALRPENHDDLMRLVKDLIFLSKNENSEYAQIVAEFISLYFFYTFCDYRGLHVPHIDNFKNKLIASNSQRIRLLEPI